MAGLDELGKQSILGGPLGDGLRVLDLDKEVVFQGYTRVVLPIDGYVFWSPTVPYTIKGSLHFSQEMQQAETETVGFATVLFTSKQQVPEFTKSPINTLFVGSAGGFRFAFSQQQGYYEQAGFWHYFGHQVYPALASQLLDQPGQIDPNQAVTSNSLAAWLALNTYKAPYFDGFSNSITLYPSFLVPPNLTPPYGIVHIEPTGTRAIQAAPLLDLNRDHYQLAADTVRVTLYGLQNNAALDFLDCVWQYSLDTGNFGIMNMPIVRDGKRQQSELQAIAMLKVLDFEVDYYQTRVNAVARQLIKSATPTFIVSGASVVG
jgi:hypothetical protein